MRGLYISAILCLHPSGWRGLVSVMVGSGSPHIQTETKTLANRYPNV